MSTTNPTPVFRPLTPADMEEYRKQQEALKTAPSEPQNPVIQDPATPEDEEPTDPQPAPAPLTAEEIEELRQYKKRFGDASRHINDLAAKLKAEQAAKQVLDEQLKKQAQPKYASDEEVQNFEKTVQTTPILKELIRREAERLLSVHKSELTQQAEAEKNLTKKQVEDLAKLSKEHPEWREYDQGGTLHKVFTDWLATQPIRIQEMADYTTTKDMDGAIAVLSMFKAQVQVKTGPKQKPTATNPSSHSRPDVPAPRGAKLDMVKWDKEMSDALRLRNKPLQEKLMDDLQKAQAEGRI